MGDGRPDHVFEDTFEIDVSLIGPSGTQRLLASVDGFDANFTNNQFVVGAATSFDVGTKPFTGVFAPKESMATSAGTDKLAQQAKGMWKLHVVNTENNFTGSIDSWSIRACVDTTAPYCGDGHLDAGEECDDGNTNNADTCKEQLQAVVRRRNRRGERAARRRATTRPSRGDGCCSGTCTLEIAVPGYQQFLKVATNATPFHIVDNVPAGVDSPVTIAGAGTVKAAYVFVNSLTHHFDGDVVLKITGPTSVARTLSTRNGSSGANYTHTEFDDAATTAIASGTAPFTGSFIPEQSLSTTAGDFLGTTAAGTWKLNAADVAAIDDGHLNSWTLAVCVGP